ncbi:hypothetical protein BpHYR1_029785, partial [Brachionus plicatilis]
VDNVTLFDGALSKWSANGLSIKSLSNSIKIIFCVYTDRSSPVRPDAQTRSLKSPRPHTHTHTHPITLNHGPKPHSLFYFPPTHA